MHQSKIARLAIAAAGVVALVLAGLWSLNTLSTLVGGPPIRLQHAIAGVILLTGIRWLLFPFIAHTREGHGTRRYHDGVEADPNDP